MSIEKKIKAVGRISAAGVVAAAGFLGIQRPENAYADVNVPVITQGPDGNNQALIPFHEAGRIVLAYGPQGLDVCGNFYSGPTVAAMGSNEAEMNLTVKGSPIVYTDVAGVAGFDYMSRAAAINEAMISKVEQVRRIEQLNPQALPVILIRDAVNGQRCDRIDLGATTARTGPAAAGDRLPASPEARTAISCEGTVIALPSRHGEIQPGSLNSSAPIGRWFNPIYNAAEANAEHNWRGIGPWAPIAFKNVDANAAELKTFGNLGHFVIRGLSGGRVAIAFWQQEQHQNDTKMRPDGTLDPAWRNQYTFTGLEPNAPVGLFDPDTGRDLNTWSDGSPINYTANELGTFSIELPAGEARVGVCAPIPGQKAGIQAPEIQVFRGPNDHPELKGENPLPDAVKKPTMPD